MIEPAPPPDARDLHGYVDAPRHRVLITVGWATSGVCLLAGLGSLVILAAPSDPCSPAMEDCGPDQATLAVRVLLFLGLAVATLVWSIAWQRRDRRYSSRSHPDGRRE